MSQILINIATLGPVGRRLPAPGTAGSALALLPAIYLHQLGALALFIGVIAVCLLGTVAAEIYERHSGKKDASEVIIDEVAGQMTVFLFLPAASLHPVLLYGAGFLLFRLFDITKLWPISQAEKIKGGIGVMADDILAGIAAGIALFALTMVM